jgi:hypothetical protein
MRAAVIVTTRNHAESITAARRQISQSDYRDFEMVGVDSSEAGMAFFIDS